MYASQNIVRHLVLDLLLQCSPLTETAMLSICVISSAIALHTWIAA